MAVVQTLIGNVKGPTGATGATGAQGAQGDAATIEVGSVTTAAYGTAASVTNSGTSGAAVLDFVIPQGAPGETVTDMQNLTLGSITSSSASFPTPTVGETGKVIFGKINKWFNDMAALVATKFDVANVVNNLTTTASGYALDARQGKALNDSLTYKSGDTLTITIPSNALQFAGRLGFSRQRMMVTIPLERKISNISSVSIAGDSVTIFADNDTKSCTITSVSAASSNNFLSLVLYITPATAWSATSDCLAVLDLRSGNNITISF